MTGYVYKLSNTVNDSYYIGSTATSLRVRMHKHIFRSKECVRTNKLYVMMREIGESNWKIDTLVTINEAPDVSKIKLYQLENEYINLDDPKCLNEKKSHGRFCGMYTTMEPADMKESRKIRDGIAYQEMKKDTVAYDDFLAESKEKCAARRQELKDTNPEKLKDDYARYRSSQREKAEKDPMEKERQRELNRARVRKFNEKLAQDPVAMEARREKRREQERRTRCAAAKKREEKAQGVTGIGEK